MNDPVMRTAAFEDACEVASTLGPQGPLFLFSAERLTASAEQFLRGFPGDVSYAVKANSTHEVLAVLSRSGIGRWDVASIEEMALVAATCPGAVFNYHNPVKSRHEMELAYGKFGCRRFAVDCGEELRKLSQIVSSPGEVEIAVRFVLPRERSSSAHDFSTKFGAPEHIGAALLREAETLGFKTLLTFHPGSQAREPQTYARHIEAAARIAASAGIALQKLNVGGGFPAHYRLSDAPPLQTYFSAISQATRKAFGAGREPLLECEPGRGIVATSMSLLTRVKLVCTDGDDIFINDGVYGGLMEYMQVPELAPPFRVIRDGKILAGETKAWKVFGPTCDPFDVLPHRLDLPANLRDEDFIEFGTLGAYGLATSTRFNGYGAHEIVPVGRTLTL